MTRHAYEAAPPDHPPITASAEQSTESHQSIRTSPASSYHSSWFRRKPLWVVSQQEHEHTATLDSSHPSVPRHLTLFDLVAVGVGGTVGSGIFVLLGYIAHHHAGPAAFLSFLISGIAACCSGVAYAELAGRIPASGSTYAYAYVAMGELPAVLAAACLTLEYMVSGAAVARSWGDKFVLYLIEEWGLENAATYLDPGFGTNPMAFLVSVCCVALLYDGVKESKFVMNVFTFLKVALVIFMTIGGFVLWDTQHLTPFMPFGISGVLRGATSSFFGYLGYDEVCCIASEALHPQRDMPRAVLLTLSTVTLLYVSAALALAGMQPYQETSDTSAFPDAFEYHGVNWAAQIAGLGEVITLPVVVLITLMAQPRLQHALAQDGLLPEVFGRVSPSGNLRSGSLIAGTFMTIISTFVPFDYLDDLISSGILIAFSMTNGCVILMRCEPPTHRPKLTGRLLILFNGLCLLTSLLLSREGSFDGIVLAAVSGALTIATALFLAWMCPRRARFGGTEMRPVDNEAPSHLFETPFVPYLPCIGTFVNWYLIAQLDTFGILLLLLYLGAAATLYIALGFKRTRRRWVQGDYQGLAEQDPDANGQHPAVMLRSISLPVMSHASEGPGVTSDKQAESSTVTSTSSNTTTAIPEKKLDSRVSL
jgi:amino acid transporter